MNLALALRKDPEYQKLKAALLKKVQSFQERIVLKNSSGGSVDYARLLSEYGENRGAPLYFPYLGSGMGRGPLVELADGSVKYDFIAGIGVHFLGHGHPALLEAAIEGALEDTIMQGNLQQNQVAAEVANLILKNARPFEHVFFSTSGAMANENALKIAFQKKFPARRVLAFEKCFAGRTLALSRITDKAAYRQGLPPTLQVDYVPFFDEMRPEESAARSMAALAQFTARYPGEHACMIVELIQGEAGFHAGSQKFFQSIASFLKEQGILLLVDEIQTFGRTTELFAARLFGLMELADLITIGKLTQVCATLYRKELQPGPGLLSQTFSGSTSAFYAARAVLSELTGGGYYGPAGKIARLYQYTVERLSTLPEISHISGQGAMIAFQVEEGDPEQTRQFVQRLFANGLIVFTAGSNPLRLRFLLPAGCVEHSDIDVALAILKKTLSEKA